ncbi:RDD family protein [Bacillus sp. FJAT-27445]|uniref:RDD family protein n=1 Tax=Bacillus sp. FJAT-27445 TaxID=1679166 RepID=UPI000B31AFCE|nr:RDD family protein [Bacillus sp. FJAT-27445]
MGDYETEIEEPISMSYAAFKIRMYAFLLDYLVIVIYGIFVVGTISLVFRSYMNPLFSSSPVTAELTGFFMMTLPVSLYFILCECSKWQGTLGKRKMGIRVVDGVGKRIGIGRSALRTAIKFLPWEVAHFGIWRLMLPSDFSETTVYVILNAVNLAILLYLIIPLTNKNRKNVYDWIAGTEVVR